MIDWAQRFIDQRIHEEEKERAEARESVRRYWEWLARQEATPC
jgi:hypothetical protein